MTDKAAVTRLDHRNYGAWYIPPHKWQDRFCRLTDPTAVVDRKKAESTTQKAVQQQKQLHSAKAFAEFIKQRKNYEPPEFLKKALQMD